jgi:radical SAM protein (TIGR01212 family)
VLALQPHRNQPGETAHWEPWFSFASGQSEHAELTNQPPMRSADEVHESQLNHAAKASRAVGWRAAGLPYFAYNHFLRERFGGRVQKVSLDAGFTCPNVDGTVATGGCTFCDNRSFSPSRRLPRADLLGQIDQSIVRMRRRYQNCDRYLAYFQPATNTYAPVERLRPLYEMALSHPQVVGMAIGTRSDCLPEEVLDLLQEIAARTYLSVEYGMQTMHDRSLVWMNRGHDHQSMVDAVERSRGRGFEICAHLILGLPGESHADMMATAQELVRLQVDAVKLHNLYCVKNTRLADQVAAGEVQLMGRDDYVQTLVDILEVLPPTMVVERISGDAPPDYFVGPSWCLDKPAVRQAIHHEFARRGSWQGIRYVRPANASVSS